MAKAATDNTGTGATSSQVLPPTIAVSTTPADAEAAAAPATFQAGEGQGEEEAAEEDEGEERASTAWGGGCLSLAFKCLHLIVDDFLERVPRDQVWWVLLRVILFLLIQSFVFVLCVCCVMCHVKHYTLKARLQRKFRTLLCACCIVPG